MKIRKKITLIFVGQIAILEVVIFSLIYFLAFQYSSNEFFDRLGKRTTIAAQAFLEKDEVNADIYNDIRIKHLQRLPQEKEYFFELKTSNQEIIDKMDQEVMPEFLDDLRTNGKARFKKTKIFFTGYVYGDNQGTYLVILSARDLDGEGDLTYLLQIVLILFVISLLILFILGSYFAQRTLSPISEIIEKANEIRASSLHKRLLVDNNKDELSELAQTFNSMLDRIETSFEMQSSFINNASHELKNPLTAILGQTEIALLKERQANDYVKYLHNIENEAHRLDALINVLLSFAKTDQDQKGLLISEIRMDELLLEVKSDIDLINPENNITIDFDDVPMDPRLMTLNGNVGLIKVALSNILDNACKFSENALVTAKIIGDKEQISIVVTDHGVGIPAEELNKISQPFYRARNARSIKGFGFGLSLTHKIMKMHGGLIDIFSEKGKGTIVKLQFNKNQKKK